MHKKILSMLLMGSLAVGLLAGCGNEKPADDSQSKVESSGVKESAGSSEEEVEEIDYTSLTYGKYDWCAVPYDYSQPHIRRFDGQEISVIVNTAGVEFKDDWTVEENPRVWNFEAITGFDVKVMWSAEGSGYNQKKKLAIANGDIPDLMNVTMDEYYMLVKSGLVADITDYLTEENAPLLTQMYAAGNNVSIDSMTIDGRIYGLPVVAAQMDSAPLVWIRQDWLKKLSLEEPKDIDDLGKIAKAFMEADFDGNGIADTYGIPVTTEYKTGYGGYNSLADIFLNVGGGAPGTWQRDEDGAVIYGSLMEENKETLELLNSWYEEGIIPSDFATWNNDTVTQAVGEGKAGIALAPWYGVWGNLNSSIHLDATCEWKAYMLPGEEGEPIRSVGGDPVSSIYVISAEFEDPSALVTMIEMHQTPAIHNDYEWENIELIDECGYGLAPIRSSVVPNAYMAPITLIMDKVVGTGEMTTAAEVKAHLKETLGTELGWVVDGAFIGKAVYDAIEAGENAREAVSGENDAVTTYTNYLQWWSGPDALRRGAPIPISTIYMGSTESTEMYKTFLNDLEKEAYTKMIMGDTDGQTIDDYFDDFVAAYLEQGGQVLTDEVAAVLDVK